MNYVVAHPKNRPFFTTLKSLGPFGFRSLHAILEQIADLEVEYDEKVPEVELAKWHPPEDRFVEYEESDRDFFCRPEPNNSGYWKGPGKFTYIIYFRVERKLNFRVGNWDVKINPNPYSLINIAGV